MAAVAKKSKILPSSSRSSGKSKKKAKKIPLPSGKAEVGLNAVSRGFPQVRSSKTLPTYYKTIVRQMVCPGSSGSYPLVSPSRGAQPVCARHIHKEFDLPAESVPNGFTILMSPDFEQPSYISSSDTVAIPEAAPGRVSAHGNFNDKEIDGEDEWRPITFKCRTSTGESLILTATTTFLAGYTWYKLDGTYTNSSFFHVNMANNSIMDGTPTANFAQWDGLNDPVGFGAITATVGMNDDLKGQLTDAVALLWRFSSLAPSNSLALSFSFTSAQLTSELDMVLTPAFGKFESDLGISAGRVVSMSCLLTNMSPMLQKGGSVNAGRVPHEFPVVGDIPSFMSRLPDSKRYQDSLENGAYVFWVPQQLDEYEIDGVANKHRQYREAEKILIRADGYSGTCAFKVHFDWIVEFYTPNQLFEKRVPPVLNDGFAELFTTIASVNAAMCNPSHNDTYKATIDSWAETGSKALDYIKAGAEAAEKYGPLAYEILMALAELL